MRTSVTYIQTSYRKIIPSKPAEIKDEPANEIRIKREDEDNVIEGNVIEDNRVQTYIQQIPNNAYQKHKERMREKYKNNEKHRKAVKEKSKAYKTNIGKIATQRIKLISLLRKDLEYRTKIKKTTLEKYNIDLNEIFIK